MSTVEEAPDYESAVEAQEEHTGGDHGESTQPDVVTPQHDSQHDGEEEEEVDKVTPVIEEKQQEEVIQVVEKENHHDDVVVDDVVIDEVMSSPQKPQKGIMYERDEILALKDLPASRVKPTCMDEKSCWYGRPKITTKSTRPLPGSGRLNTFSTSRPHYREKTGREFCEDLIKRQNGIRPVVDGVNVTYYNPVNRDHRRIMEEQPSEEPEWMSSGPTSRYDMIDLHGFDADNNHHHPHHDRQVVGSRGGMNSPPVPLFNNGNKRTNLAPPANYARPFQFDDFNARTGGSDESTARPRTNGSRFKRYFKRDNMFGGGSGSGDTRAPTHEPANQQGNMLLNLLHGQQQRNFANELNGFPNMSQFSNMMSGGGHGDGIDDQENTQFNANKPYYSGRAIVDVLSAFQQQQQRQMFQQQRQHVQNDQVLRMFELHRQIQQANPGLNYQANNPQFWQMIHQRQQAYYQHYEQQVSPRKAGPSGNGNGGGGGGQHKKHRNGHGTGSTATASHASQEERIAQFFTPAVVAQASTVKLSHIDVDKAMKVEEFERKIKEVAATCKKSQTK